MYQEKLREVSVMVANRRVKIRPTDVSNSTWVGEKTTAPPPLPNVREHIFVILSWKRGTCDQNGIGLSMIGKDHIFRSGCWFTFPVRQDAAIFCRIVPFCQLCALIWKYIFWSEHEYFLEFLSVLDGGKNVYLIPWVQIFNCYWNMNARWTFTFHCTHLGTLGKCMSKGVTKMIFISERIMSRILYEYICFRCSSEYLFCWF
jgi:hypothetical protein